MPKSTTYLIKAVLNHDYSTKEEAQHRVGRHIQFPEYSTPEVGGRACMININDHSKITTTSTIININHMPDTNELLIYTNNSIYVLEVVA